MIRVTSEQIEQLQIEAGAHGDDTLVDTCNRALDGDMAAWAIVAHLISDAQFEAETLGVVS